MKTKILLVVLVIAAALLTVAAIGFLKGQRADFGWKPAVASPAYSSTHPRVVVDEAHHNASTAGIAGRYRPFARLLEADGYDVRNGKVEFSPGSLEGVHVLVIVNASGAPKPNILGINLPVRTDKERDEPAFTAGEIEAVRSWVDSGGSLLLIADHAPFGAACEAMAAGFGVRMYKGFVEVPGEQSDPLLFTAENGRLGDHPIIGGDSPETAVRRVATFTGQSLDGPPDSSILLRLPETAVEYVPGGEALEPRPAGGAQGVAFDWGLGRVVVLGEAAMLTAQVSSGDRFGMNSPGNDNRQLALNIMHWLSRKM
jgi:hypothetical protein